MTWRTVLCALTFLAAASADTLTLRDGKSVQGTFIGGDSRQIRMLVGDSARSFAIGDVATIEFGAEHASAPAPPPPPPARPAPPAPALRAGEPSPEPVLRPAPEPAAQRVASSSGMRIPGGTTMTVRMIDDIDSQRDSIGQTFKASLDEAVTVDGNTLIPRGADVLVKLVDDKESGKLSGRTELTLDLVSVIVNGRSIDIDTQAVTQASSSRTARTGKVVGGTAALGAVIGAIAGGGKGAAIGAVSGAGAGGAVQVLTKGQRVQIPSETRLTFTLQQPINL